MFKSRRKQRTEHSPPEKKEEKPAENSSNPAHNMMERLKKRSQAKQSSEPKEENQALPSIPNESPDVAPVLPELPPQLPPNSVASEQTESNLPTLPPQQDDNTASPLPATPEVAHSEQETVPDILSPPPVSSESPPVPQDVELPGSEQPMDSKELLDAPLPAVPTIQETTAPQSPPILDEIAPPSNITQPEDPVPILSSPFPQEETPTSQESTIHLAPQHPTPPTSIPSQPVEESVPRPSSLPQPEEITVSSQSQPELLSPSLLTGNGTFPPTTSLQEEETKLPSHAEEPRQLPTPNIIPANKTEVVATTESSDFDLDALISNALVSTETQVNTGAPLVTVDAASLLQLNTE